MPRRPRVDLPGIPSHLVQRGNDRQCCFRDDLDRRNYLAILQTVSSTYGVEVHAWVLMDNHVHLLSSTHAQGDTSRMMQVLGATYVRRFNERHGRTGTLWEGRFHSCPIDCGSYLWNCHRYIEMNPVRAGLAASPAGFAWSSFGANALGRPDTLTKPRPEYLALGESARERRAAYRMMFGSALSAEELDEMRRHLRHERPLGSVEFTNLVQAATGLSAEIRSAGRPRLMAWADAARQENLL